MQTITLQPGESVTITAAGSGPQPPDPPVPPEPPSDVKLYPLAIPNLTQTLVTITSGVRTNDVVAFQITTPAEPVQLKLSCTFIGGPVTGMYCAFNQNPGDFTGEEFTGTYISLVLKQPLIAPGRTYYLNIRYENPQDQNNADLSVQFNRFA